jgi:hypothetical protein
LRTYAFPTLGTKSLDSITQADVKAALLPIWTTIPETARRVRQRIATVMDWAGAEGYRERANPVAGVEKALPAQRSAKDRHHAMMDWPRTFPRSGRAWWTRRAWELKRCASRS